MAKIEFTDGLGTLKEDKTTVIVKDNRLAGSGGGFDGKLTSIVRVDLFDRQASQLIYAKAGEQD